MKETRPTNVLYKSHGIMWRVVTNALGVQWLKPVCPVERCNAVLEERQGGYWCCNCERNFPCPKGYDVTKTEAERKWEGASLWDHQVVSLDLPPTKVSDGNEDENYWLQARIVERNGRKMAVVYLGEKVKNQGKMDYVQLFLDLEDEQMRFDKSNKNPMRLLAKLIAEFPSSRTEVVPLEIERNERATE